MKNRICDFCEKKVLPKRYVSCRTLIGKQSVAVGDICEDCWNAHSKSPVKFEELKHGNIDNNNENIDNNRLS